MQAMVEELIEHTDIAADSAATQCAYRVHGAAVVSILPHGCC